ncbi:Ig-like domain-containing protein, partial [Acinetobacter baumannii]|nr:Ig-like domain-containing protein [Acinetobacter baumannii]
MPEIQIIAKDNHKTLVTTEGTSAKLSEASVVLVKVAASDVLVVNREGTNAVIRLKNGETIVIEGFFSGTAEPKDNSLVFQDENGQLIWAKFKDAENDADADSDADADADSDVEPQALLGEDLPAALPAEAPQELVSDVIYQPISSIEPLLYHDAGVNPWLWAAIPLVAGGIIAAASNHDSNDDSSTPTDTTPPATPSVPSGYLDNVGPDQGIKGSGSSTDDTTPGVVISAPGAGETPTLYVDGEKVAASYDPVTGTLTPTTPLADGSHQLTYTLTDAAGNESAQSPAITVTVDTLAPATPSVPSGYLDNVGPDQGIKGSGSSTDDTTPGVVISAPGAGETPTLYVDGEKVAASYDPVTGTLTPTTPLADGSHQLTYTLTDAAGNESAQSPALLLTVDTTAPGLVITALDPALTATESTTISFTFSEAVSGFDIDDITPVGGTLSNLVQSTTNPNVWTATFTADGSGAAPSISVADGAYTDLAGNLGTGDVLDGTDGFVVDTLAPAPVITIDPVTNAITIDFGEAVNAVDGSPLTADALEGLLDIANGTLTGLVDNGDGSFSGTLVPAADFEGDVVVNVPAGIVTDVAGNANLTATESLTVDTLAPAFDFTVTINADGTATIAGSTEPGATVEILDPAGNPVAVTV